MLFLIILETYISEDESGGCFDMADLSLLQFTRKLSILKKNILV